jgi:uroporphyrinogen decarboxylase
MEVAWSPLAEATSVEEVEAYDRWPSADWFDYGDIERQCDAVREKGRVAVFMGDRMNRLAQLKPAMYLRGVEQILADMLMAPEIASAVFARLRGFYVEYADRIFKAANGKLDLLLMGDDFGSQQAPLISPAMWVDFLGDGFLAFTALAKHYGLRVMHHTCGSVRPLIPLMIERGLDILQSLQPEAADMDPRTLKQEFGSRLAFHGGLSIQRTLPFGTPDDVRREVKDRIAALAPGGGYILCTAHNIQADAPLENVKALLEACSEFGRY